MIYLDAGATSFWKPETVHRAVSQAMKFCANPGRSGHRPAMLAAETVFACREAAGKLFRLPPEQVVFTKNCTEGLNMAIRTLVSPGDRVVISGFEHNAVTRPLHALDAEVIPAGRRLFDWEDTLEAWEQVLRQKPKAAVFTCVSNVFGYILPVSQMAELCRQYQVPFIIDAAQGAGSMALDTTELGADFVAMPGHKGLLGPQGTGLLLCQRIPEAFLYGGTGSLSRSWDMPDFLPDRMEAGTLNVPGIAGLNAGIRYVLSVGPEKIAARESREVKRAAKGLCALGIECFHGDHQAGVLSFRAGDCEALADRLGKRGICLRAGLHCAPLAHESAGTLETGTIRISYGADAGPEQTRSLLQILAQWKRQGRL